MTNSEKKKGKKEKKTSKQINEEFNMSLAGLQDSLASLRVVTKYIQYDLEATRRENETLKAKLQKYEAQGEPPISS